MRTYKQILTDKLEQLKDPVLEECDTSVFDMVLESLQKKYPHWEERMLESWAAVFTLANVDDFELTAVGQYEDDEFEIPLFTAEFEYHYGS